MITIPGRHDQSLAVFGLSASGLAAARALTASGIAVAAWDDDSAKRKAASEQGIATANLYDCAWSDLDGLVLSPGVPLTHPEPHPVARLARAADCPIIGDIELLVESCPEATFVGVTGTNGKSTTTSLIAHILATAGKRVEVGGNLGPPALALEQLGPDGTYVLELSSYQLDLTQRAAFDIAVFLNLTPDHLDRHGDMAGYLAAKRRIFRDRDEAADRREQVAVIGIDDEHGRRVHADLAKHATWRCVPVAVGRRIDGGIFVIDGRLHDATAGGDAAFVCDLTDCATLPGAHNWQNAAASYAASRALGLSAAAIRDPFATFPGLPHRQELVATIGGVRYVNDSKATNGDAAARAVACYDAVYLIAGGLAKENGLGPVLPLAGRIRHAFLIGAAAPDFAAALDGKAPATRCGDLATATQAAHAMAQADHKADHKADGATSAAVLLSPACASFDQWPNFEARGDAFRGMVRAFAAGKTS